MHIDVCERRLADGKLSMFLAIERVSKFTHDAFLSANTKMNGAAGLRPRQCLEPCARWWPPSRIASTRC